MRNRVTELSCKEVINVCDGTRYGFVNDVEVDCECGRIISLIIQGKGIGALFSRESDILIPWEAIKKIGDDIILVEYVQESYPKKRKTGMFSK